ncbi:MAG: pentapeptide repeat-containing protein [Ktedonobacterales bacterium]
MIQEEVSIPYAAASPWGASLADGRRRELAAILAHWRYFARDAGQDGPFAGEPHTGADIFCLAALTLAPEDPLAAAAPLRTATVDEHIAATLRETVSLADLCLQGADLRGANLHGALPNGVQLQQAQLQQAQLQQAQLAHARLSRACLVLTRPDGANLCAANLDDAHLSGARLSNAELVTLHAERVVMCDTRLEDTNLSGACLIGANPLHARLARADLRGAVFDAATTLEGIQLADRAHGPAALGDVVWDQIRLTRCDWRPLARLGDERFARWRDGADAYRAVVRAYRQLAVALRAQGLHEDAKRLGYRAQVW